MKWIRFTIETSREAEDIISNLLMEMGAGGVQIEEAGKPDSGEVLLKAYFPLDDKVEGRVRELTELLENMRNLNIAAGSGRISLESLDEIEWSEVWKRFFKPLPIGERMLVFPPWEGTDEFPERDVLVQINPGMAFGTGGHSSTTLSLELLEKVIRGGEMVADIGTGSGILAITAAKLGAMKVTAVDVDVNSPVIARENSRQNGVSDRIIVICGDLLTAIRGKYDVIVSNINARTILSMIPEVGFHLNANGYLILSGILGNEIPEIKNRLDDNNLKVLETRRDEEWAAVLAKSSA